MSPEESLETVQEQSMPTPEVDSAVVQPQQEPQSLEQEHPHLGQTDIEAAVADNPVPPEGADREQKIVALNESAKKLVFDDKDPQNKNVYAARVQEKMSKFTENDEKRKTPLVDLIHEKSGKGGDAPNNEQMKTAIDRYGDVLDEYVEQQIGGRELNADLLRAFGFDDEDIEAAGDELTPEDIKKHIREAVRFEDFSTFLYEKLVEEKVEEAIENVDVSVSGENDSSDLDALKGLPEEEKKSKIRSIIDTLGSEAEYQFFENKQNNLDAFLDAFFDVNWRDRSGYGSYDRVDKNKEKSGHQIGAQTIKESLGGEAQSMDALISLQKAVIAELGAEGPFASADYKKLLAMGNEEFRAYITGKDGSEAWIQAFNGANKGKALGRLSAWVSGTSGDNEYKASKSMLEASKKAALQQNLPKDGNYGMTQEALAYLFTR